MWAWLPVLAAVVLRLCKQPCACELATSYHSRLNRPISCCEKQISGLQECAFSAKLRCCVLEKGKEGGIDRE